MDRSFTLDEAREELAGIRDEITGLIGLRAELTVAAHADEGSPDARPLADLKAMEARLAEIVDGFRHRGIQVKGWAPLLLDFPSDHAGRDILFCWLEGDEDLAWYHDAAHGFAGRRPLGDLVD